MHAKICNEKKSFIENHTSMNKFKEISSSTTHKYNQETGEDKQTNEYKHDMICYTVKFGVFETNLILPRRENFSNIIKGAYNEFRF